MSLTPWDGLERPNRVAAAIDRKGDMEGLLATREWALLRDIVADLIEQGRDTLEVGKDPDVVRGEIKALRRVLQLPDEAIRLASAEINRGKL